MRNDLKRNNIRINYTMMFRNILILLLLFFVFSLFTTNAFSKKELATKKITVEENQTVWNIAKIVCKKNTSLNIQEVIYDIKKVNSMDNSTIYEGQELLIPIY